MEQPSHRHLAPTPCHKPTTQHPCIDVSLPCCSADPSGTGWEGAFTAFGDSWPTPSNTYFVDMLRWGWVPEIVGDRKRLQVRNQTPAASCSA